MKKTIYYWSPCLTNVGTVKSTLNSAISFAKYDNNLDVRILNVFGEWTSHKKYLENNGVKVENLFLNYRKIIPKYGFVQSRISYILISILSFIPLLIFLKRNKIDYFVIHLITSLPLILFNLFKFRTKLILRISGYPKLNLVRKKLWSLSKNRVYKVTCPSKELSESLKRKKIFFDNQIYLLPDAILSIKDFIFKKNDSKKSENLETFDNFFLSIGRFTKQKNYFYLIEEFKKFCIIYPNEKLIIIGEGELKSSVQKKIIKEKLTKNIFIFGPTDNVYQYMLKSKAFILPSLWEEVGFVIVESALSNTLVISSDCPNGPSEFLNYGNGGILFQNNKQNALLEKLKFFIENENSFHNAKLSAKKNCKNYTLFNHYKNFENLLNENKI